MEMLGGYQRELAFYRHVAGRAPIQTPHVYAARMVEGSADFVLVLEDLRDWDNADHLAGLSLDRARLCIEQLAGLHAWSIEAGECRCAGSVPEHRHPDGPRPACPRVRAGLADLPRQVVCSRFRRRSRASPSGSPKPRRQALQALTERSMLLHGDIRADNMFFDGDQLKVVDFQFAAGAQAPPTSPTWSARDYRPRCVAATTRRWCANTSMP